MSDGLRFSFFLLFGRRPKRFPIQAMLEIKKCPLLFLFFAKFANKIRNPLPRCCTQKLFAVYIKQKQATDLWVVRRTMKESSIKTNIFLSSPMVFSEWMTTFCLFHFNDLINRQFLSFFLSFLKKFSNSLM